jgi:hypothetical protein
MLNFAIAPPSRPLLKTKIKNLKEEIAKAYSWRDGD